jgi:SAM-dependent methyltransferase
MNPQYTDNHLEEFYNHQHERAIKHHRYGYSKGLKEIVHEFNIKQIESYVSVGHFLSVGCGEGLDLKVAQKRGWIVEGYEVNKFFIEKISKQLNAKVRNGDFCKISYDNCHYDCVYLNHVLEHTKNPAEYLRKIYDILKRQGILYIACPNIDSLSNRIKTFLERIKVRKKIGRYYDTDKHLFYFNPFKLRNVLETYYSFKVISLGNDIKARIRNKDVKVSFIDHYPYKSSFRLIAKKI